MRRNGHEGMMPELPEVETVRAGLSPVMESRTILKAAVNRPDLRFPLPDRLAAAGFGDIQVRTNEFGWAAVARR